MYNLLFLIYSTPKHVTVKPGYTPRYEEQEVQV